MKYLFAALLCAALSMPHDVVATRGASQASSHDDGAEWVPMSSVRASSSQTGSPGTSPDDRDAAALLRQNGDLEQNVHAVKVRASNPWPCIGVAGSVVFLVTTGVLLWQLVPWQDLLRASLDPTQEPTQGPMHESFQDYRHYDEGPCVTYNGTAHPNDACHLIPQLCDYVCENVLTPTQGWLDELYQKWRNTAPWQGNMTTLVEDACGASACPTPEDFRSHAHLLVDDTIGYAPFQTPVEIATNENGSVILDNLSEGVQKICRFLGDTLISQGESEEVVKELYEPLIIHMDGEVYHSRTSNSSAVIDKLLGNLTRCASFLKS
ncbi:hypothetical protein [Candidatus Hepatobacter penaei]|uniref:hypothetical protein n=1 Tax=Candidatus Hepatobacter penaei TaxID=1274402 RepID=UPI0004F34300|nr:hypothetical protein [Candidatus Hepatobacter penaei]